MDEKTLPSITDKIMKGGKCVKFIYHNAHCFKFDIPIKLGPAQTVYYDVAALKKCCKIIKE